MWDFEEFKYRRSIASRKKPRVAIQRRGTISLSAAAYEMLGRPQAVILLYDQKNRVIAFQPSTTEIRHAFPVRPQPNSSTFVIAGGSFFVYYNINTDMTRAFEPVLNDGMLVIELDQGVDVLPRKRGMRGSSKEERGLGSEAPIKD